LCVPSKCTQHQPLQWSPTDDGPNHPQQGQQFCESCFVKGKPTKIQLCGLCGAYHTTHNFGRESAQCLLRAKARNERGGGSSESGVGSPPNPRAFSSASSSSASSSSSSASSGAEESDAEKDWALPPTRRPPSVARQTTMGKAEALLAAAYASAGAASTARASPPCDRPSAVARDLGGDSFFKPLGLVASPPAVAALSMLADKQKWHGRPFYYRPPSQLASEDEVVSSLLALAADPKSRPAVGSQSWPATLSPAAVASARPEARPEARGRPRARALAGENVPQGAPLARPSPPPLPCRAADDAPPRKKLRPALSPCAAPQPGEGRASAIGSAFFDFKHTSVA
jgi:hypothetical protein